MKTIIRSFLLLYAIYFYSPFIYAQSDGKTKKLSFKIYMNGQNEHYTDDGSNNKKFSKDQLNTDKLTDFGNLSFAVEWNTGSKFFQEIDWQPLQINSIDDNTVIFLNNSDYMITDSEKHTETKTAFRYQLSYGFFKERKWSPYLGISSQLSYFRENSKPKTSLSFPMKSTNYNLYFTLVPGIKYSISDRFFADINVPIGILNHEIIRNHYDNPSIPSDQRSFSNSRTTFLPKKDQLRIGIGYLF